jgi:hypothetical protein
MPTVHFRLWPGKFSTNYRVFVNAKRRQTCYIKRIIFKKQKIPNWNVVRMGRGEVRRSIFVGKPEGKIHLENLGIDKKKVLIRIFKK